MFALSVFLLTFAFVACGDNEETVEYVSAMPVSSTSMTETATPLGSEGGETGDTTEESEEGPVIFASVSAGGFHLCQVRIDDSVACWGLNEEGDGAVIGWATPAIRRVRLRQRRSRT